ncbi:choice-of-anchor G family protein [Curtobacterium sp. VKM Ac-1393]|uniref:choice-of-anchor G family protein n=1 Tax=Curtobacterium sp. VKM Ac-1393 TaxID=2783814 RepID=UPI001889E02A|nr:choice-of-anchor G family protein [Curtobacterium sp. VKM Ac-1393]MBF4605921.1 choice-of-anchor G family protein [Curtobacterium sp. VKM Ac-1393]
MALLGAGGSILAAAPATAAPVASTAQGRFVSGSALGVNLDDILTVTPANAVNSGGATDTDVHPLDVTALNAVNVNLGGGLNLLGNNGILALGAVNQYAAANADGSSVAASGAVTNTGGIGVGGQDGVPQSNATLDLSGLIGPDLAGALANAQLEVGAVSATAAQAAGPDGAQTGDYGIAGLDLSLTSPALGSTVSGLRTTLGTLQPTVDGVQDTLNALGPLGPLVQVQGLPDLVTVLDSATGDVTSADGSITANLQTGAITIDVAAVLTNAGLDINNLPANTELLPYITDALTTQLLPAVTTALQGAVTQITQSLRGLTVTVAGLPLPVGQLLDVVNPVIAQVVAPINQVVAGLGETVVTPLAEALTTVVSLQANVQETSADGVFTQRALRLVLVPTANTQRALVPASGTAVVNLASAAVGPNAGPLAVPTATSLDPDNGPVAGGTTVTVTGTGFTADATVSVDGSDPIEADSVSDDGTELTFTTPAHAAGTVDVTVTTPAGTSDPLDYTYNPAPAAVPTLTTLDPDNGPVSGGTLVTVTGTGFTDDATVSVDGSDPIDPESVSDDGTELTFTTPAHVAGPVDVTVTTDVGTSDPLTYTYNPAPAGAPTLTALDPDNGPVTGGTVVTVSGTGFTDDSTVSVDGSDPITPDSVSDDGTELTFTTPAHTAGAVPVTVTNGSGTSAPLPYTYNPAQTAVPTISSLDPDNGPAAGGTVVTVTGTGFTDDSTVSVDGSDPITPASVSADGTSLTFTTPAHAAGDVEVTVTTAGGTSDPLVYTYNPASTTTTPPPVITSPTDGGTVTTPTPPITGTGQPGATVTVTVGTVIVCTAVVAADGTWKCTPIVGFGPGTVTITATQTGPDGTSAASDPVTFTVRLATAGNGGAGSTGTNGAGPNGTLAYTGSDPAPVIALAILLMLAGVGLTIARRFRRA